MNIKRMIYIILLIFTPVFIFISTWIIDLTRFLEVQFVVNAGWCLAAFFSLAAILIILASTKAVLIKRIKSKSFWFELLIIFVLDFFTIYYIAPYRSYFNYDINYLIPALIYQLVIIYSLGFFFTIFDSKEKKFGL